MALSTRRDLRMELTSTQLQILDDALTESVRGHKGVEAIKFRAARYTLLNEIDQLEKEKCLIKRDEKYYLQLAVVVDLKGELQEADFILMLCAMVYDVLQKGYKSNPGGSISLNEIGRVADIPRNDVNKAISYLVQLPVFLILQGSIYTEDASISPSESVLKYSNVKDIILNNRLKRDFENVEGAGNQKSINSNRYDFINNNRIKDINKLVSKKYDFSRLTQICNEINSSCDAENYIATGALIRILIDHVPPALGYATFQQVAANYPGKSLKQSFEHLEKGARKIADQLIHQVIRKKEVVPTFNTINYSQTIDVLLAEIIRKTNEDNA